MVLKTKPKVTPALADLNSLPSLPLSESIVWRDPAAQWWCLPSLTLTHREWSTLLMQKWFILIPCVCMHSRGIEWLLCQCVIQSVDTKMSIMSELITLPAFSCNVEVTDEKSTFHMLHKQESYNDLWKARFLLHVQIVEQNHTSISIFPLLFTVAL